MKTHIEYKTKIAKECLLLVGMIISVCAVGVVLVGRCDDRPRIN